MRFSRQTSSSHSWQPLLPNIIMAPVTTANHSIITEFNNQGVTFIEQGCYSQALIMFQGAYQVLINDFDKENSSSSNDEIHKYPHVQPAMPIKLMSRSSQQQDQPLSRRSHNHCQQQQENAAITMLVDPIKIPPLATTAVATTRTAAGMNKDKNNSNNNYYYSKNAMECILALNKALATHLLALDRPPSSLQESLLDAALSLYEEALAIIPDNLEEMDMCTSCFVNLTALNNMCLIHHEDLDDLYDAGLEHYYDLRVTIEWLRDSVGSLGLEGIWRNASINSMILSLSQVIPSSAPLA